MLTASWGLNVVWGRMGEKCELEEPVRSTLCTSSCSRARFLGLPGAPSSLNLHVNDRPRQREQPLFSPEHLSFRVPVPY
jgi:hypothetical protein